MLTLVWTEFGRRAKENGSGGTDHGAAGTGFLIGTRAAGTQVGEFPGLATGLDEDGNLKATADFRGVYASLLEQWLHFDASRVIPNASSSRDRSSSNEAGRRARCCSVGGCCSRLAGARARAGGRARVLLRALAAARAGGLSGDPARELRQDPHDLRVQRIGARHIAGLGDIAPGARGELTVKLAPGRYSFWCSIANHRRLGMRATLVVTR